MHRNMWTDIDFFKKTLPLLIVLDNLFSFFGTPSLLLLLLHLNCELSRGLPHAKGVSRIWKKSGEQTCHVWSWLDALVEYRLS